jgi:hypothetical protein
MAFGKITHNGPTQQELRTRDAKEALERDDQKKAPWSHRDRVQAIREREYGKQTTAMPPDKTRPNEPKRSWGGGSDNVRKVK